MEVELQISDTRTESPSPNRFPIHSNFGSVPFALD
jgi:hypothetical protein